MDLVDFYIKNVSKKDKIVWVDKNYNSYSLNNISNRYLINILNTIYIGSGHFEYMSVDLIKTLYGEMRKRKLTYDKPLNSLINAYYERNEFYYEELY